MEETFSDLMLELCEPTTLLVGWEMERNDAVDFDILASVYTVEVVVV